MNEYDLCYPSVQSWPGTRCQGTEVFQLQIEVIILIVLLSNFSMIRKYTEENHGGGDEENHNKPTVQTDHSPPAPGTAAELRLTGKYPACHPDRGRQRETETGGDNTIF